MKKMILLVFCLFCFQIVQAEEEYVKGKILSLEDTITAEPGEEEIKEILIYKLKLLSGDRQGEEILLEHPIYRREEYNIETKIGDSVVLYYEHDELGKEKYYISDVDKRFYLGAIALGFILLTILVSKKNGIKALFSLAFSILFIFKVFIPSIILGYSPILFSIITGICCSFVTIYLMTGLQKKGFVAMIGTMGGVLCAGIISYFSVYGMRLSGYETTDSLSFALQLKEINLRELISAGVIIGSMGAVMDVAMSIASAMHEIEQKKPNISRREIFTSALNLGNDIIGTMINTLILAYIGSSLLVTVMIVMQKDQFPMIRLLNFENIATEILRSLTGSLGILVCVPITAYIGALLYGKKTNH